MNGDTSPFERVHFVRGPSVSFEQFEFDAIAGILETGALALVHPDLQAVAAGVLERTFTCVGFSTTFGRGPESILVGKHPDGVVGNVAALLNRNVEVGLILKIENNRIAWLEGYTFGSDRWPAEFSDYEIFEDDVREV